MCVLVSVLTCTSVLRQMEGVEGQNSGNTLEDKEAVSLGVGEVETLLRTQGFCRKSVKSMDSLRKGVSRGSLKPFVSVHSREEAEKMKAEITSSPVAVFPCDPTLKMGDGEGVMELAPESDWTNGSGLGSWGTVASEDVGVLALDTSLASRLTSNEVGGVGVKVDTELSLSNSSSGVTSERNSCMRRSVVAGSLSRREVSRYWDSVMSANTSTTSGGRGPLKSPDEGGREKEKEREGNEFIWHQHFRVLEGNIFINSISKCFSEREIY